MARTLTRSLQSPLGFVLLAMAFGPVTRGAQLVPLAAIDLPQPVKMTAQEDHQRVMDLLGITSIPPGPIIIDRTDYDMGTAEFPPMEKPLVTGKLAFRQHGGARTDVSNWPTLLTFAARYQKSNGDIVRPPPIARRAISDATRGLQDITLSVKKQGGLSPLSGRWIWSATVPGTNRKPGEITLKVKVSGSKVTGNWTEKETRNDIDGVLQVTDLSDGHVIDASSIAFKRCEGTVYYSTYTDENGNSDQKSAITFTKCERDRSGRLKPNQTVAEFIGRISGNDLILTVKEIPSH